MPEFELSNNCKIKEWQEYAREYVINLALTRRPMHVSVNDVYLAMCKEVDPLPPPPDVPVYKRGHAMCRVFLAPMFRKTGNTLLSVNPVQRSRRIIEWEYFPSLDERYKSVAKRRSPFDRGGRDW